MWIEWVGQFICFLTEPGSRAASTGYGKIEYICNKQLECNLDPHLFSLIQATYCRTKVCVEGYYRMFATMCFCFPPHPAYLGSIDSILLSISTLVVAPSLWVIVICHEIVDHRHCRYILSGPTWIRPRGNVTCNLLRGVCRRLREEIGEKREGQQSRS